MDYALLSTRFDAAATDDTSFLAGYNDLNIEVPNPLSIEDLVNQGDRDARLTATLIDKELLTEQEGKEVLGLVSTMSSQSLIDQGQETTQTDLDVMRLMPKILNVQTAIAGLYSQISIYDSTLQQLWQGVDVEFPT